MTSLTDDPVIVGRAALARADWSAARAAFDAAIAAGRDAEGLDGLGWLGWWTSDADLCLHNREGAFRAYRASGRDADAALAAAWLASDHLEFRGDDAVARGWIAQAHRAADGLPEGPATGLVLLAEAYIEHAVEGRSDRALELAIEAQRIGREHGVVDLEAIGLAQAGLARVSCGDVQAGLRDLDAAAGLTLSGDLQEQVTPAWALCMMLAACARLGDVPRAEQWCSALKAFADRYDGRHLLGSCRTSYGCVLTTGGDWDTADAELTAAVADLAASRAGMASGGLARLGALRARQGRTTEARELFERALPNRVALIGLGELALEDGDAGTARDAADRALRRTGPALDRLPSLELLVQACAALGDLDAAAAAHEELERIATTAATPYLVGRAHLATAQLALARGDGEVARRAAEDATDAFGSATAPYDQARARMVLAQALEALDRPEPARAAADAARDAFAKLGARREAAAVSDSGLTARELEVLRLVAQGLSDPEVAERLVVSPHTVHRHVANIRAKLRLPSRAAAVAYAAREGLL